MPLELGIAELRIVMTLELGIANCSDLQHGWHIARPQTRATDLAVEVKRVLAKATDVRPHKASINRL